MSEETDRLRCARCVALEAEVARLRSVVDYDLELAAAEAENERLRQIVSLGEDQVAGLEKEVARLAAKIGRHEVVLKVTRAEVARLRAALFRAADALDSRGHYGEGRRARAALAGEGGSTEPALGNPRMPEASSS